MKRNVELNAGSVFTVMAIVLCHSLHAAITIAENPYPADGNGFNSVGAGMGSDSGVIYDNRVAQTFMATTSGYLESVTFYAYRFGGTGMDADLRVSVTEILGGQPGIVLESAYAPFSSISIDSPPMEHLRDGSAATNVVFSATTLLESGMTYALVFSSDTPVANYRMIGYSPTLTSDNYLGGERLRSQNASQYVGNFGADLNFRVQAAPVPEPRVLGLLAMGCATACLFRNRRGLLVQ